MPLFHLEDGLLGVVLLLAALVTAGAANQPALVEPTPAPAFDQPINPNLYMIRPGDKLAVTFIKSQIPPFTLTIDAEGMVIDRDLGVIDLSEASLTQARQTLETALKTAYNVDRIAISITEPREVSIRVTGAVAQPGIYTGFTSQRVSDILASAGGITDAGSRRRIVFSGGPNDLAVDLDRAFYARESAYNPYLYAGRHVHVLAKSPSAVQVVGEVNSPREVELVDGDDLGTIIRLAGGFTWEADTSTVRVVSAGGSDGHKIESGDVVMVPARQEYASEARISVFGAVKDPGLYRYTEGLTLKDLLASAGGFLPQAAADQTVVFRRAEIDEWGRPTDAAVPIGSVVSGREVIVPFTVTARDSVFVPIRTGYVKVTGEVLNPGLFPFVPGKSALYYIAVAGGFAVDGRKDRISKFNRVARTSDECSPDVLVQDGEVVVVGKSEGSK